MIHKISADILCFDRQWCLSFLHPSGRMCLIEPHAPKATYMSEDLFWPATHVSAIHWLGLRSRLPPIALVTAGHGGRQGTHDGRT